MKKRLLCLALAILMVMFCALTGCSSEKEPAEPAPEAKTVQFLITGNGKQADSEKVWAAFNELLQTYVPNTTVEFTAVPFSEYSDTLTRALAAGEGFDMVWSGWLVNKPQNIADGNLMPLDDLLAEYGQGIAEVLTQPVIDLHRYTDGKLYQLPSWQGLVGERRGWMVIDEIAALAGDTWMEDTQAALSKWRNNYEGIEDFQAVLDQATKYLAAAKEAGKLGAGINTARCFGWNMNEAIYAFLTVGGADIGVQWGDDSFQVNDAAAQEHYKLYCKTTAEWYKAGYIRSDIMSIDTSMLNNPSNGEITENTYILSCEPYLTPTDEAIFDEAYGMEMSFLPIEDSAYLIKGDTTGMSIPYCADEPERAMMVLNAIYTQPDLYNMLVYGLEGEHYTKNADGTINTPYSAQQPSAEDKYGMQCWLIGSCKNVWANTGLDPNYYADLAAAEADAKENPFINFSFDRSSVEDICANLLAAYYEYAPQLDNGVAGDNWEEVYNNYVAARKAAGVDKLIEEFQSQLDDYAAANNITSW